MTIPDSVLGLAGLALAQAVREISELSMEDVLSPFAIIDTGGKRETLRFPDPRPNVAVADGHTAVTVATKAGHSWAFAWENPMAQWADSVDALSIDFWAPGMEAPVTLFQRFELTGGRGGVHLLGDPGIVIGGIVKDPDEAEAIVANIRRSVMLHGGEDSYRQAGGRS